MSFSPRLRRTVVGAASASLLAFPLAACGGEDGSDFEGSTPVASISPLSAGKNTQIALDQGFVDALGQLELTPKTLKQGKLRNGTLVFPITGGNVSVFDPEQVKPYVVGSVEHDTSGLQLAGGGTRVRLLNFTIDPGASKVYADVRVGKQKVADQAYVFFADGSTLEPAEVDSEAGTATLTGTTVKISPVAADLLNSTFGTDAVKPGLVVGTATITAGIPS
ncbi:hypothetical protein KLP28_00835 [Nocardioidaceae bacterium]|nr:hypothetical protein KLP28_00835 [Nocardioidaceae bacterium]